MAAMVVCFTTLSLLFISLVFKLVLDTIQCYFLIPRRIKNIMEKQGVRGPKPRGLTGNKTEMFNLTSQSTVNDMDSDSVRHDIVGRLLPHYVKWSKSYGKRFIYWHGIEPRMCLTETELIKELMTKHHLVTGKSWLQQQGSKHFTGRGLLMANGQDWYHQRHIAAPAFMGDKLKSYSTHMVECTKRMLQSLENAVKSGQKEFEIGEHMVRLTADIIARTEFDTSYEKGKKIFHLLTSLQHLCAQASRHLCFPGSRFYPTKYNREMKSLKMEVDRLLMEIIQSRKDCFEIGRSSSYGNDLLGNLLNEMEKKRSGGDKFKLNLQMIMDECKTFFFVGHETTALLLTWTVMLLATNPHWQQKVRAEFKQVCNGGVPSLDQLSKLTQLHMVINESLRLYPPATVLPRMAFENIKLGDLFIPKGLSIWIPVLAIHHSQELWGQDANEFNPDRFNSRPFTAGRHFMPFAAGPRNCIGQSFAMMEVKIILVMLISQFSFTISENYRHAPVVVMTLKPKYGVQVYLKPLEDP
ncbi:cytokinin hydroxylase-like isoform X1 [Hibiscus syriacus]|uniref:cytokinin hydroxylase-like isoform X1 n=1 Tax=Hibiscus syriacus TaxID=106335 RepID=UPI001922E0A8|nr:cytokinin hydroxylase-like isoform X1 [Hibiscus syriacus]